MRLHFREPGANGKIDRALIGGISKHPYNEARKRFRKGPANEEHQKYNVQGARVN